MSEKPVPVDRPLTDRERDLLNGLLIWKVRRGIAQNSGVHVTTESVVAALADLMARTPMHRNYDAGWLHITTGRLDQVILRVSRQFLTFHASHDERITEDQLAVALANGDIA